MKGGLMRRRFVLGGIAVAFGAAALLFLAAGSADASTVRERIMAKRAANGWDCSSGDCVLPSGGRDRASAGRERTNTASVAPAAAPQAPAPEQIGGAKQIEISLAEQRLRAYEGQRLVLDTAISSGSASYPTPTGSYSIRSKEAMHWSTQYSVWMPHAMRVVGGIFIHELPIGADGQRIGASEIGSPTSHGCIRVPSGAAQRLFSWAEIGTPVLIR
jgi:hypothetical protein